MKKLTGAIPDRCCLNCQFFLKRVHAMGLAGGEITSDERKTLEQRFTKGSGKWLMDVVGFKCHQGVYDKKDASDWDQILPKDRKESCFFFPYHEGMDVKAADVLERRIADRCEAERDRALTKRAFWVAFAALVVSILATIASIIVQVATAK